MSISVSQIGDVEGRAVLVYTLKNVNGVESSFTNLGAIWISTIVPDKDGKARDVLLGFDRVPELLLLPGHMGAPVGRNANRISGASMKINGAEYKLAANNLGVMNLHSGPDFLERRFFDAACVEADGKQSVIFTIHSPDGDQGYPGNADITISYTLCDDNSLLLNYKMRADQDTIGNFTNHVYFNLDGYQADSVLEQLVWIDADSFTATDEQSIPTGEIRKVEGTPMDFRKKKRIGQDINEDYDQLRYSKGYDHNYCLNHQDGTVRLVGSIESEKSGIKMEIYTDLEGMQFYTGNYTKPEAAAGKEGIRYVPRQGCCFETQHYPDAINRPEFPSPIVKAGEEMNTTTIYKFMLV